MEPAIYVENVAGPIPAELALDVEPVDLDVVEQYAADMEGPAETCAELRETIESRPHYQAVRAWRIEDDDVAEWAMRKVAFADASITYHQTRRDDWVARIDAWLEVRVRPIRRRADFLRAHLTAYALRRRDEDGVRTVKLPSGQVSTRQGPSKIDVADAEAFRRWALERPDSPLVRLNATLVADEARKTFGVVECARVRVFLACGHERIVEREHAECILRLAADTYPDVPAGETTRVEDGALGATACTRCAEVIAVEFGASGATGSVVRVIVAIIPLDPTTAVVDAAGEVLPWARVIVPEPTATVKVSS